MGINPTSVMSVYDPSNDKCVQPKSIPEKLCEDVPNARVRISPIYSTLIVPFDENTFQVVRKGSDGSVSVFEQYDGKVQECLKAGGPDGARQAIRPGGFECSLTGRCKEEELKLSDDQKTAIERHVSKTDEEIGPDSLSGWQKFKKFFGFKP